MLEERLTSSLPSRDAPCGSVYGTSEVVPRIAYCYLPICHTFFEIECSLYPFIVPWTRILELAGRLWMAVIYVGIPVTDSGQGC